MSLHGIEVIDNALPDNKCDMRIVIGGAVIKTVSEAVTYQANLTPLLKSINPRFGSVVGGENVTFYGENFSLKTSDYKVLIDNQKCIVNEATVAYFKC